MSPAQVSVVQNRYRETLKAAGFEPVPENESTPQAEPRKRRLDHALFMCQAPMSYQDLTFVQGVLWSEGVYQLDELREHVVNAAKA